MRAVVVGASSGLGRCIGIGLAQRGAQVALLARRRELLDAAAAEAGSNARAIACDVTDESSVGSAIAEAAASLDGIDALVYAPAIGPLARLADTDAETWRRVFDTNVTGAAIVTRAAIPHLTAASGTAAFLSSVSASLTAPWPGLGAYAVSKAALDKLVEAWRVEHPEVGFTRFTMGDCIGGDGHSTTELLSDTNPALIGEAVAEWAARKYFTGNFIDVDHLVAMVGNVISCGSSSVIPSLSIIARVPAGSDGPDLSALALLDDPEA
jgi:NADP-dependent 3-hydroxy acid dehydrogenase YdfG